MNKKIIHVPSIGTFEEICSHNASNLLLASLCLHSNRYYKYYKHAAQLKYTILDSGIFEVAIGTERAEVKTNDYIDLAMDLGVHEVICPDIPWDPTLSTQITVEFVRQLRLSYETLPFNLMIVPHGKTVRDWTTNLEIIVKETGVTTVGIPRTLMQDCHGQPSFRVSLATLVQSKIHKNLQFHLLGAAENFFSESELVNKTPIIRSMDTTFIFRYLCSPDFSKYQPPQRLSDKNKPANTSKHVLSCLRFLNV